MLGVVMHAPGDFRVEQRADPEILHPTDAVIRLSATCVCDSDLWPYRGLDGFEAPAPIGHEYVGTQESMLQAVRATRPGGHVGYVGVSHDVTLDGLELLLFYSHVHLHGGPAPVRAYLARLIELIWIRTIEPGRVFDLEFPLTDAAEAYKAMDERRAVKALLRP